VNPRRVLQPSLLSEVPNVVGYRNTSLGPLSEESTINAIPFKLVPFVAPFTACVRVDCADGCCRDFISSYIHFLNQRLD
jgi:hypothetical protein